MRILDSFHVFLLTNVIFGQKLDSTKAFRIAVGSEIILYSTTMYALNNIMV